MDQRMYRFKRRDAVSTCGEPESSRSIQKLVKQKQENIPPIVWEFCSAANSKHQSDTLIRQWHANNQNFICKWSTAKAILSLEVDSLEGTVRQSRWFTATCVPTQKILDTSTELNAIPDTAETILEMCGWSSHSLYKALAQFWPTLKTHFACIFEADDTYMQMRFVLPLNSPTTCEQLSQEKANRVWQQILHKTREADAVWDEEERMFAKSAKEANLMFVRTDAHPQGYWTHISQVGASSCLAQMLLRVYDPWEKHTPCSSLIPLNTNDRQNLKRVGNAWHSHAMSLVYAAVLEAKARTKHEDFKVFTVFYMFSGIGIIHFLKRIMFAENMLDDWSVLLIHVEQDTKLTAKLGQQALENSATEERLATACLSYSEVKASDSSSPLHLQSSWATQEFRDRLSRARERGALPNTRRRQFSAATLSMRHRLTS